MPIILPKGLPASRTLRAEGIEIFESSDLARGGHRPLRICLVNLMPNKPATEAQIARLIGATSIPVEIALCIPDSYRSKTAPRGHLAAYYRRWSRLRDQAFDGLIVTGAPVENLPFEDVTYWRDMRAIFDWARGRAISGLYICWAAQAALYHFHGVPKHGLPAKMFGVFRQLVMTGQSRLLRGFGEEFPTPVSRYTEVRDADLPAHAGLSVLAAAPDAGLCLVEDRANRAVCMFNHLEYDTGTLGDEFRRDRRAGRQTAIPRNYFPADDPGRTPMNIWQPYGHLLFANWLAEIYQAAGPRVTDEALIQWAFSVKRDARADGDDHSDLLIAATGNADVLPCALRALADVGIAPRAFKVHRRPGSEQLIELRMDRMEHATMEKIARRLGCLSAAVKIAFRTQDGAGGWFVADCRGREAPRNAAA